MKIYKAVKGKAVYYIFFSMVICNLLIYVLLDITNSYILTSLLKSFFVIGNIYQIYFIILSITLKYNISDTHLRITAIGGLRKILIPLKELEGYKIVKGKIKAVNLFGFSTSAFALGKSSIYKIGVTSTFVTNNKKVIYLKAINGNYAISPEEVLNFEKELNRKGIRLLEWKQKLQNNSNLYKEKKFYIPFFVVSVIILILTLNPFVLYLKQLLPIKMPLSFDTTFNAVEFGTGKQFAFNQMAYGFLNMALLFCMYYASYFYAKYDRKSAYKFIYVPLVIACIFLIIQIKILLTFS